MSFHASISNFKKEKNRTFRKLEHTRATIEAQNGEMQRNKLRVEFESRMSLQLAETFPLDFLHTSSDSLCKIMGPKTAKEVGKRSEEMANVVPFLVFLICEWNIEIRAMSMNNNPLDKKTIIGIRSRK